MSEVGYAVVAGTAADKAPSAELMTSQLDKINFARRFPIFCVFSEARKIIFPIVVIEEKSGKRE